MVVRQFAAGMGPFQQHGRFYRFSERKDFGSDRKSCLNPRILRPRQLTIPVRFEDSQAVQDSDMATLAGVRRHGGDGWSMIEARSGKQDDVGNRNVPLMKFDAARARAIFEKLGDPAFAGATGEDRIADFAANEFQQMGWNVGRREVEGSRFPQRVGPWIGWLGYGAFVTVCFCMILSGNGRLQISALLMVFVAIRWPDALASNSIRPGKRMHPMGKVP